jgi:hypothetical protein
MGSLAHRPSKASPGALSETLSTARLLVRFLVFVRRVRRWRSLGSGAHTELTALLWGSENLSSLTESSSSLLLTFVVAGHNFLCAWWGPVDYTGSDLCGSLSAHSHCRSSGKQFVSGRDQLVQGIEVACIESGVTARSPSPESPMLTSKAFLDLRTYIQMFETPFRKRLPSWTL